MGDVVFLFDVDNTLLDNDRITADLKQHLAQEVGPDRQQCYWTIFEQLRAEFGYADYLGALQRYRIDYPRDPRLLTVSCFLVNYPFANRLFPNSLDVVDQCSSGGRRSSSPTATWSSSPERKIERSGLFDAVDGNVLIYIHKEQELDDVAQQYPAKHYVLVDDKLRILTAVKKVWNSRVTTVFPRQGHYARDQHAAASYPAADVSLERIGDL